MDNMPIVSVITVVYNGVSVLEKTINSIMNQNYSRIEYIVIDGGSDDGTIDEIKKYENKINYFVSEPDMGIYDAMNKGIQLSTGDWIIFMNCGDVFESDNSLMDVFSKDMFSNMSIVYGKTVVKENNKVLIPPKKITRGFFFFETICHQSIFFNKSVFEKIGLHNLRYKIIADRELLLRSKMRQLNYCFVDVTVCVWESKGYSLNNLCLFKEEEKEFREMYYSFLERILLKVMKKIGLFQY